LLIITTGFAVSSQNAILLLTPGNGTMNVTTDELIMIHTTKEAAFDSTGQLTILQSNSTVFESISFNSNKIIDLNSTRIIIDPQHDFQIGEQYSIQFKSNSSAGCVSITDSSDWHFRVGTKLEETILYSKNTKTDYRLLIMLPNGYRKETNQKYPVIYITDGGLFNRNQYAQIADAVSLKIIPEVIVVGIGYPRQYGIKDIRQFRDRDMCRDSNTHFAEFINDELIPNINKQYRTKPSTNTLMGNSCGGIFTTSMFFRYKPNQTNSFKNFIAVAQILNFQAEFNEFKQRITELPVNFYLSIGDQDLPNRIEAFNTLVKRLEGCTYPGFRFEHRIIEGAPHGEVSSTPSFKEALRLFLGN